MSDHSVSNKSESPSVDHPFSSHEILVLKELAAKPTKSFWRDYSLLVSLCAFLLSFVTAIISAYISHKRDIHDQLSELAVAIRSLQELNLKQIDINEKYGSGVESNPAVALIANQIYNTTVSAAEIVSRLGSNATTASIIPISQNLYSYGLYLRAEVLAQIGLGAAQSMEDELAALRWLGTMKIRMGTAQSMADGAQFFTRALNFDQRYGGIRDVQLASFLKAGVQLDWSEALAPVDCNQALNHFDEGYRILTSAGHNFDLDKLRRIAATKLNTGIGNVISCKPDPTIVLVQ